MSNSARLLPVVTDNIHFDTLFAQAKQAIATYAGKIWTDTGEHDPGVTFLEALSYSVSDLAYRHTLPLTDLLTPPVADQIKDGGIFPAALGPQTALTTSPITEDDYRRAILDLCDEKSGEFYFRNVQLCLQKEGYRYTYDTGTRQFSFVKPIVVSGGDTIEFKLRGNYVLHVEPTQNASATAKAALDSFLTDHRNLGESVDQVIWAEPQPIIPRIEIELEEAVQDFAGILAEIYTVTKAYISPSAKRYTAAELVVLGESIDDIYKGPSLSFGWLPHLPPVVDYSRPVSVNLGGLAEALSSIDGIRSIVSLHESNGHGPNGWSWETATMNRYPQLWGADPISGLIGAVRLMSAGGEYVVASKAAIEKKLVPAPAVRNTPVVMPYGRVRDVAQYYPVSDKIPPCYGLQQTSEVGEQSQAYPFLLPFEQMMANGCRQLAMLPRLLSFDRHGQSVWGAQWPYAPGSIGDQVHAAYSVELKHHTQTRSDDYGQELAIVGHLLGYFGVQRAARMLNTSADEFLKVEQRYLGNIADVTYGRDNIRIDKVSALQKRIAARLGFGSSLFDDQPDLRKLPFYLVEHRALLPVKPAPRYDTISYPANLKLSPDLTALVVTQPYTHTVNDLRRGQLIDFSLQGGLRLADDTSVYTLRALIVDQVDIENNSFRIKIKDNSQLQIHLSQVLAAHDAKKLFWKNCQAWLEDLTYPLSYAKNQSGATKDGKILSIARQYPFPALVQPGDELVVRAIPTGNAAGQSLRVSVQGIDVIARTLTVVKTKEEKNDFPVDADVVNYSWGAQLGVDRFSFVVSLVMNKAILPAGFFIVCLVEPYAPLVWLQDVPQLLLEIPACSTAEKAALLSRQLEPFGAAAFDVDMLSRSFHFTPETLPSVIQEASLYGQLRGPDSGLEQQDLRKALRLRSQQNFGKLAQRLEPKRGLDDLLVSDDLRRQLEEIAAAIKYREGVLDKGFADKVGYGTGISALFYGPSGTGKTMAAEVLAAQQGVDLVKVDLSTVVNKYIGETEKNLSRIFDLAQADSGVLFFDEADALFGKRSETKDAQDRHANIEVSYLLQRLESYPGLVILATNNRGHLDPAFSRRFTFITRFTYPDVDLRERMWRAIWPRDVQLADDVNFDYLAKRADVTGANIRNVALLSTWLAANESDGTVQVAHIELALQRELAKVGRLML